MQRSKIKCELCGQEISMSNYSKHIRRHNNHPETFKPSSWALKHEGLNCQYCGKEYKNRNSLCNHERQCSSNPNKQIIDHSKFTTKGLPAWNKGLTKETDERIKNKGIKLHNRYVNNEIVPSFLGKKHSLETKELMKQKALNNCYQRKCKKTQTYMKKDGEEINLDSSYEVMLAQILDTLNIKWERPNCIKWVDSNNVEHNYFPDFYLNDYDLYLDPKNEYCFQQQEEKINFFESNFNNFIFIHKKDINEEFIKNYSLCCHNLSCWQNDGCRAYRTHIT